MTRKLSPDPKLSRRRFLMVAGAAAALGLTSQAAFASADIPVHRWRGIALGAEAEIRLVHPDKREANRILKAAEAEIRRLEAIFSLYREDSALVRLNREGSLAAPPLDLVSLLGTVDLVHSSTGGAFDPTVQPLWSLYARHFVENPAAIEGPDPRKIAETLGRTGWYAVDFDADRIRFTCDGMALTLNGIAQGYVTDRVAALLKSNGISDVLVDVGEINALGRDRAGSDGWAVTLDPDHSGEGERVTLRDRAVASSARNGMLIGGDKSFAHILDPRTGRPVATDLAGVSVIAPTATLADGLSTAALVTGFDGLKSSLGKFDGVSARALLETGELRWLGKTG
ncbi:FAD:protein FMN transferase [Rhizobiales bacterium]|uniref:FAD:protein FMN transferase n=1 Tax=Hongsoonwoonella zoysiae TaxID=2821844 RepID=UPI00155FFED9|nr:FAD:protein FMN transferase [Hongsoonwoonella zoysiae]NRG18200.1 FAD:protein FMN transferase [Hongsoonwoonella zoysiae]